MPLTDMSLLSRSRLLNTMFWHSSTGFTSGGKTSFTKLQKHFGQQSKTRLTPGLSLKVK